ncbi:uncharacterized protein LOC125944126 [Dermacentor silvarum]|uniref:uncharacterized protein LOC125944126 n=1 Tax=Dermacentor silvarum TaxID=543639 RepID=UPI002100A5C5|nr:uncharacterized protein LOC125944126 [Dermacentor silvarum]
MSESLSPDAVVLSDNAPSFMQSTLSEQASGKRGSQQRPAPAASGSGKQPDLSGCTSGSNAPGSSRRPASSATQAAELRTASGIIDELQRSQLRDQRRVAAAAVVACSAILVIVIVMAYVIVSSNQRRPLTAPPRNATAAAVWAGQQLSALQPPGPL